jgi:hypothetical protein
MHTMPTPSRSANTSHNSSDSSNGGWTLHRQPKEPEADLGLSEIAPNRLQNRILLGIALVVLVVAVLVGVVLSKSGGGSDDKVVLVENRTIAVNETSAPSSSPVTTTEQPTAAPSVPISDQFLNGLPAYSINLAENDADSAQAKALAWLKNDPQYHYYGHVYRLNQRYALAVFYYSTNDYYYYYHGDPWWNNSEWLSNDNECTWYQYNDDGTEDDNSCTESSRLSALSIWGSMAGSIPAELELLTDVEYMRLSGELLSGTIPSEL